MNEINHKIIIEELSNNIAVFRTLLEGVAEEMYLWKANADKWCPLEIICHLYDEEREDFRARTKHVLETPELPLSPIDPTSWVQERRYVQQNYSDILSQFLKEREDSVKWLQSFPNPKWDNVHKHPKFGKMTANLFLSNWLAHDYLHIRQITKLKFDYLKQLSTESLNYAGDW